MNDIKNFVNIDGIWLQTGKSIIEWQHDWKYICKLIKNKYGISSIENCRCFHTEIFGLPNILQKNCLHNIEYWNGNDWYLSVDLYDKLVEFYVYPYESESYKIYEAWNSYYNTVISKNMPDNKAA